MNQKFPPDLLYRVRESIEERGFCVFGNEEMGRLFSDVKGGHVAKRRVLDDFAALTGAKMETTPNLNSARFVNPLVHDGATLILHSPVCPEITMDLSELEPGLFVYTCPKSGGVWIPFQSYLKWKERPSDDQRETSTSSTPVEDAKRRILVCPESGRLLIRYKVGHGLKFRVDLSPDTGGIWLDRGKWEALKSKGLHVRLNEVFTAAYQREIRAKDHEERLEEMFRRRIGPADCEKVILFKRWLVQHEKRRRILCYLLYDFKAEYQ